MTKSSLWDFNSNVNTQFNTLDTNIIVDTVIIGAGITGITAAINLIEKEQKLCVIESHSVALGTSGYSTGNLYIPVETFYQNIVKKFDFETAKIISQSRKDAIDFIENMVIKHSINCDFHRRPFYFFTNNKASVSLINNETSALINLGINIEKIDRLPFSTNFLSAAKLDNQARFNPLKYLRSLANYLSSIGCDIYENTPCLGIKEEGDYSLVHTPKGNIKAKKVIIATHLPIGINKFQILAFPYRSYAVAVKLKGERYPNGNFWDIRVPGFAISTHNITSDKIDTLIVSGSSHKTGQPGFKTHEQHYKIIENYIYKNFEVDKILYKWSAQHYQPSDGIPYIGSVSSKSKNIFIATGYNADGLTYGTVAGLLLADLVQGKESPVISTYNSNRFKPIASAKKFIKENVNSTVKYLSDYPSNVDAKNLSGIEAGEGKIIEKNGEKFAVYRDDNNELHVVSAVCTHLKCIVKWNEAEVSWDCPCHGSRFNIDGSIIEGPALCPLKKQHIIS
ncbi:FAD dependent oxidoreductase [endosymbiont of Acanthamoeba sp. UWC8]|nr:FAD dependent oxidoreductase [endosymbiont of Acanthamoeba sp. UWC8]